MKTIKLKSGALMPALGQGTWTMTGDEATWAIEAAIRIGFRHIDTADRYGNHREVGQAIRDSGVKREEIFLTSKIWHEDLAPADLRRAAERFLAELGTDYLDLLLIHWPNRDIPVGDSLRELGRLKEEGLARDFGVSNFTVSHLKKALATGAEIAVNQVEFHPSLNQKELKDYCDKQGIIVTAYSPLAQGRDFGLPVIAELAGKYGRTPAQIILNWLTGKGMAVVHGSRNEAHIKENLASQDFTLTPEDRARIESASSESVRVVDPPFAEFDQK